MKRLNPMIYIISTQEAELERKWNFTTTHNISGSVKINEAVNFIVRLLSE